MAQENAPEQRERFPLLAFDEYNEMDQDTFHNVAKRAIKQRAAGVYEWNVIKEIAERYEETGEYAPEFEIFFAFPRHSVFYFFGDSLENRDGRHATVPYMKIEKNRLVFGTQSFSTGVNGETKWHQNTDVAVLIA